MKRSLCFSVALAAILTAVVLPLSALTPSYNVGEAYQNSPYYDQLLSVELTGDMRYDVLSVAFSQLGYHEGDSEADMDGLNVYGNRNFVEYNRIFGKVDNGEGNGVSYGYAWCAAFVSWCLRQAGVPKEIAVTEISCNRMTKWFQSNSEYHPLAEGYTPVSGDIIMFHNGDNSADHVGLVVGVKDGKVYTGEGNSGGVVGPHMYSLKDTYILGYCVPAYSVKEGTNYGDFPLDDNASRPGEFMVVADTLNIRSGAGTSYPQIGKLGKGDIVTVTLCDGTWGRIDFEGEHGWISMSYVVPKKYLFYTVKYEVGDGRGAPASQRKNPGASVTISDTVPTQKFYSFVGWTSDLSTKNIDYKAGDTYAADADLTLYAVWKPDVFSLTLKLDDGEVWKTLEVEFGKKIVLNETPEKATDGEYKYTFAGWDKTVPQYLREDYELVAKFDAVPLTDEEKAALNTTEATETAAPPAEKSCAGFGGLAAALAAFIASVGAAIVIKKHSYN